MPNHFHLTNYFPRVGRLLFLPVAITLGGVLLDLATAPPAISSATGYGGRLVNVLLLGVTALVLCRRCSCWTFWASATVFYGMAWTVAAVVRLADAPVNALDVTGPALGVLIASAALALGVAGRPARAQVAQLFLGLCLSLGLPTFL